MSAELIEVVKELGAYGVAIYALYQIDSLKKEIREVKEALIKNFK